LGLREGGLASFDLFARALLKIRERIGARRSWIADHFVTAKRQHRQLMWLIITISHKPNAHIEPNRDSQGVSRNRAGGVSHQALAAVSPALDSGELAPGRSARRQRLPIEAATRGQRRGSKAFDPKSFPRSYAGPFLGSARQVRDESGRY
jgi:hypothetical protein